MAEVSGWCRDVRAFLVFLMFLRLKYRASTDFPTLAHPAGHLVRINGLLFIKPDHKILIRAS